MNNFITKLWNFTIKLSKHFLKGEFGLGLYTLSSKLPYWFFTYNQGTLLLTESLTLPKQTNPEISVKIADDTDYDEIYRICGVESPRAKQMLDTGAVCFMAALDGNKYSSVAWAVLGKCYIRGMGYLFNFGENSHYTFGLYTLPEARKKGMNVALLSASINYAVQRNISKFYSMVEFTNHYALQFHEKLGYKQIGKIKYINIFCIIISIKKDIITNRSTMDIFFRRSKGNYTVI